MLVTFKTPAYADITMFGDAAADLLKLMGNSGNVPGAILADDVADALSKLKSCIADEPNAPTTTSVDDDEKSNHVALATRAAPLIELLEAAAASGANVMWDS